MGPFRFFFFINSGQKSDNSVFGLNIMFFKFSDKNNWIIQVILNILIKGIQIKKFQSNSAYNNILKTFDYFKTKIKLIFISI